MKVNKELEAHVRALGEWAAEDKKRVAFVVCAEITEDVVIGCNSLVGRNDRIARVLAGNARRTRPFERAITRASEAINSQTEWITLCAEACKDDVYNDSRRGGYAYAGKTLANMLKEWIHKND